MKTEYKSNEIVIPAGYRKLDRTEIVQKGDLFAGMEDLEWDLCDSSIGDTVLNHFTSGTSVIRPIEKLSLQEAYKLMAANCGIEKGDTVRVIRKANDHEMGWMNSWIYTMDEYIGRTFVVSLEDNGNGFNFDGYSFPFFVLELVKKAEKSIEVKLNKDYTAVVKHTKIMKNDTELKVTVEQVRKAAGQCDVARDVIQTMFPDAFKEERKKITDFEVGDLFIGENLSPVVVVRNGYQSNFYSLMGLYGFEHYSSFGREKTKGISRQSVIQYLNDNDAVFVINLNDKVNQLINDAVEEHKKNL